ncbi:MAG TPA: SLBB domain-containing protein [Candidatus Kapabacteria bacterium]|nr:SLBB domain-containing protein [Candidatus Kapabacteria bacterium]
MKYIYIFLLAAGIALMAFSSPAVAQFTAPLTPQPLTPQLGAGKPSLPPTSAESMTFESSIDPAEYHMGPGDVLECRFWTSGEAFYPVVSSDDMLLITNLGAFDTRNKTFAEVRGEVMQKATESFAGRKSKTDSPLLSLTLYQPRKVYVRVQGDVASPSIYALTAATRADVAVEIANKIDPSLRVQPDAATEQQLLREKPDKERLQAVFGMRDVVPASERYITVTHGDGTTERVDLVRYHALHDPKASPPLREGDVIVVPFRDLRAGSLGVYGAVQSPGDFEFVPGDSLSAAIQYAFGPSADADIHHVELTRITPNGDADPPQDYDLAAIEAHTEPDVALMPNDRIIVRSLPEEHKAAVVVLRGEVREPGVYPITSGETTLSEVVHEAGGLTSDAYPAAGVLLRHGYDERLTAGTPEEEAQITRLENLGVSDTSNFQKQMADLPPTVEVDMEKLFVKGDHSVDVALKDGDEIDIPTRPTTVYVYGFVNNAGYVNYRDGAPLQYYIAQAGGYSNGATPSRTVVIKLRSKAWMDPGDTKIEPGDYVYVPKTPNFPENYTLQNAATITALALSIAGFGLTLYGIFFKH